MWRGDFSFLTSALDGGWLCVSRSYHFEPWVRRRQTTAQICTWREEKVCWICLKSNSICHYVANSLLRVMNDEYIVESYVIHENQNLLQVVS